MFRKIAIWGYDKSLAGLLFGKVSEDTKVGYTVGTMVGAFVIAAQVAFRKAL